MAMWSRVGSRSLKDSPGGVRIDTDAWTKVDPDALPPDQRGMFKRRQRAIELYLQGASDADIRREAGMSRSNIYRLIVGRCLPPHADGELFGWRGALPFLRMTGYQRKTKPEAGESGAGSAGALQWLFASPKGRELEQRFRKQILVKASGLVGPGRPKLPLFRWLLAELRELGYERRGEWPFNVERMGYVTIGAYIDRVLAENPRRQRLLLGGEEAQRKAIAGDGSSRPDLGPFDRVECDAHKLDVRMVVAVPSPHGGHELRKIHRLWVIVLLDVASRAVLGYHLSLRKESAAEDVLRAIKRALSLWVPRKLHFSDNAYAEGAGLPSCVAPHLLGACWNEFSVDGALANVCARVEDTLKEVVGCRLLRPQDSASYTSRRSKDDRPFIEAFFGHLAAGGLHRLAPTTGSRPADKHGADPAAIAEETAFQLEYAEELLDTLIANYNATPHSGLGFRSPLAQLQFRVPPSAPVRHADPSMVGRMVGVRRLCTVLGGAQTGRRPHFNFANARYSAEWLALRTDLLGKNLWLQIENEDDARFATVSDGRGLFLGVVRAAPPWHQTPHSLFVREAIRALERRRLLHLSTRCDAIEELIRHAEANDGKLPLHPAYLEVRRILVDSQAKAVAAEGSIAMPSTEPEPCIGPTPKAAAAVEAVAAPGPNPRAPRNLPKAKTW
jgi:transposase InsO family protein